MLDTRPYLDICFAYIFLVCVAFHSPNSVFQKAAVLNFDVQFINLKNLVDSAFTVVFKKTLSNPRSQRYSMFSSRSISVSGFTFRYEIHFELIFFIRYEVQIYVYFFANGYPITLALFVEKIIFSPLNCLHGTVFVKNPLSIYVWACLNSRLVFSDITVSCLIILCYVLKSGHIDPPTLFFSKVVLNCCYGWNSISFKTICWSPNL